jgi:hypothetical protein
MGCGTRQFLGWGKPIRRPHDTGPYTKNKQTGEAQVRLVGPDAIHASGAVVPVITKSGEVHMEELGELP